MATPRVSEDPEVQEHYTTQVALTAALVAALQRLWPSVNPLAGAAAKSAYSRGVAALTEHFAQASISLSTDFYDAHRAGAGIGGTFNAAVIDTPPQSLIDSDLDWAFRAMTEAEIQHRVEAAIQKAVADAGRDQVVAAVAGDEKALGFARVPKPDACYFCLEMAIRKTKPRENSPARPGVYKSRGAAGQLPPNDLGQVNRYHNDCQCVVEPVFSVDFQLTPQVLAAEELYKRSTVNSKRGEGSNDFRRALATFRETGEMPPTPGATPLKPAASSDLGKLLQILADSGAQPRKAA